MSDGCRIDMQGMDNTLRNLREFTPRLKAALALDAQNIATEMEEWTKTNASWTDRTSNARQFLKATVSWKNSNELIVTLSHHVDYGVYLELCNEGRYAILEQAIQQFAPQFQEGWRRIIQSSGVI
ncbi:hypothetical protein Z962_p0058 (plasmid) [Clostridium botulinum C/D str. BKT12695]|nr:hypothetical protein Z962_p0058 [Clostridium botulinum C/D str. BKT12695]